MLRFWIVLFSQIFFWIKSLTGPSCSNLGPFTFLAYDESDLVRYFEDSGVSTRSKT